MVAKLLGIGICLVMSLPAFAEGLDECMADFQVMKDLYDTSSADSELNCSKTKHTISFFANATSPLECVGEDEWHLEAKAITGKNGKCTMRLHGSPGEACGADEVEHKLEKKEAEAWKKFLKDECEQ